jgi:hypothetical protein
MASFVMRLTLRTLLAYLDDTLEPAQAKLIGQKVAESEAAQELMARIKQVTRRRRLTTPPLTGPGTLDANGIAEYLDNVLPPEKLAELEEICLSSDVHLAEAAACHQILTLVVGEPALVPPTARQRMYRLNRGRESAPDRRVTAVPIGQGTLERAVSHADEEDETLLLGLPLYRRGEPWFGLVVPLAAACLLIAAAVAIWMAVFTGSEPLALFRRSPSHRPPVVEPVEEKPQPQPAVASVQPNLEPQRRAEAKAPAAQSKTPPAGPRAPPAPNVGAEASKKTEPEPEISPAIKPTAPAVAQAPTSERRELGKAVWTPPPSSVLLQRTSENAAWRRVALQKRVSSTDYLVNLPGYRSELHLDSGAYLQLWGNLPQFSLMPILESSVILHANPDRDLDFSLDRGRVVISNHKDKGPAQVRVRFGKQVWDLTLADKSSEVALDLCGRCLPFNKEIGGAESVIFVRLYALKGETQLKVGYEEHLLTSPSVFDWDTISGPVPRPMLIPRPPNWWTNKMPPITTEAKEMQAALDGLSRRLVAKDRIDVAVAEALHDPDQGGRILAVRCLGALNDFSRIVDTLANDPHLNVRLTAIDELHHLLGLGARFDEQLLQVLKKKNYSEGQAQTIRQLLHGFSPQQWANRETQATVAEYLNHEKPAIRQLAHHYLMVLVPEGRKIPYNPTDDAARRENGSREWEKLIQSGAPARKPDTPKSGADRSPKTRP